MKLFILYHLNSEDSTSVEHFASEFTKNYTYPIELVSLETRAGADLAELYDIDNYPAVLIIREDNHQLNQAWQGKVLPAINDVVPYLNG